MFAFLEWACSGGFWRFSAVLILLYIAGLIIEDLCNTILGSVRAWAARRTPRNNSPAGEPR